MTELISLLIGTLILIGGIPLGNILAKKTKEELKSGQKWFRLLTNFCLLGGFISLSLKNDFLMFTFFFMVIITSRSLKKIK